MRGKTGGRVFMRGKSWWIAFHDGRGREFREPVSRTYGKKACESNARELLATRIKEVHKAELDRVRYAAPKMRRITVAECLNRLKIKYELHGKWNPKIASIWKIVKERFELSRCEDITKDAIEAYQLECKQEGLADGTINRRTWLLLRAIKLADLQPPKVAKLEGEKMNARQGFFEDWEVRRVLAHLPPNLSDAVLACYLTSWRRGEIFGLKWSDIVGDTIFLPASRSKNRTPRKILLKGELAGLVERRRKLASGAFIFHRGDGKPIQDFRHAWRTATKKAGCAGKLVHDLRRSRIRMLVRGGTSERVCMAISGHKTRSTFDRYNITSEADLGAAQERTEIYVAQETEKYLAQQAKLNAETTTVVQ